MTSRGICSQGAALLALVLATNAQSLNTECYHKVDGIQHVTSPGGGPCGVVSPDSGFLSCCAVGDQCVEGGLCHFTHPSHPYWNETGYYVGGCTDSSLADPNCNLGCENLSVLDITFNTETKKWFCCGADASGNVTCNDPTTQTVVAKPIASIATTYVVPSVVATASATGTASSSIIASSSISTSTRTGTSTSASTTQSSTATGTPNQSSTGGTSHAGAIAGGVIGGVAFVVIIIGGGYFWYRRRQYSPGILPPNASALRYELDHQGFYAPLGKNTKNHRSELDGRTPAATEMDGLGARQVVEMP